MALWGKTDNSSDRPNWINLSSYPEGTELVFVDRQEAQVTENKARGIHGPGWWLVYSYVDAQEATRYKAECVVSLTVDVDDAGDAADDAIAADLAITITGQPDRNGTVYVVSPGTIELSVEATTNGDAVLAYQWYDAADDTPVEGATTATVTIADVTAPMSYYVVVSSGGTSVESNTVSVQED